MAKIGDYAISEYQGGVSSMSPSYGDSFTGYHIPAGELGGHTNPGTANQIQEINKVLNQGAIPIEIMSLDPAVFEAIPRQHFKEINRMQKLTGSKISLHAPLVEPSGISSEGGPWQESERERVERQLKDVMAKALELDDKGRVPVTIHTTGNKMLPGKFFEYDDKGEKVLKKSVAIDKASGQLHSLMEDAIYYPESEGIQKYSKGSSEPLKKFGSVMDVKSRLKSANANQWDNEVNKIIFQKSAGDRILNELPEVSKKIYHTYLHRPDTFNHMPPDQQKVVQKIQRAHAYIRDASLLARGLFSKAFEYGSEEDKVNLQEISRRYTKDMGIDEQRNMSNEKLKSMSPEEQEEFSMNMNNPFKESNAVQILTENLRDINPQMIVHIDDFAREKSAKTFANVAFDVWGKAKKVGKEAPILSVENMFPGTIFSDSGEMNKLIEETRRQFVEKAIAKGISENEAKRQAEKSIGVTLDVAHLNLGRSQGMKEEDLIKEAAAMAKNVKHIHLSDNFGFGDSHLVPGMGNVPTKEILMELEKAGTLKGSRKIVEAGGIIQHFQTSPLPYALEGMGSPMFSGGGVGPYWSQTVGLSQGYNSEMGMILPNINYQTFGAGFSQLPAELGGQAGGGQGNRMSGRGME